MRLLSSIRDGQYQLLNKLGAGGMGEVYQARDTRLNRLVAVKILSPEQTRNKELQRRFIQEAQAASALNHPNIITIYDIISEGGSDFMIMEFVAGQTLDDLIPKGGLRVPQVIGYGAQIASALAAAHQAGIIHRDLKPGNIMVTDSGHVKILDFGLAKVVIPGSPEDPDATMANTPLTMEGSILGTVCYMSPEQAQAKKVDARSDIFAFGAVLYEMATGRRAFDGRDTITTLTAVLRDEVAAIAEVAPDTPQELEDLILRCLRKDPDERPQSMKEVEHELNALKRHSDSGVLYRSRISASSLPAAVPAPPAAVPARKLNWGLILIPIFLLGLAAGGFLYYSQKQTAATPANVTAKVEPALPSDKTLTNDDVMEMVREKVPLRLIVSQIRASKTKFDLSAQEVIRLVKGGVPEPLIEVMRDPSKEPPPMFAGGPPPGQRPGGPERPFPGEPKPPVGEGRPPGAPPPPPAPGTSPVVKLNDAHPVPLALSDEIPEDAAEGLPLKFTVATDVVIEGHVVIAKGAQAAGQIFEAGGKRKILTKTKTTYRLTMVQTVDGKQVRLRATPNAGKGNDVPRRPLPGKGAGFIGYIDGEVAVAAR